MAKNPDNGIKDPIEYFACASSRYPPLSGEAERELTSLLKETRNDLFSRCYLSKAFLERLHEATKREDGDANLEVADQFSPKKFAGLVEEAERNLTLSTYSLLLSYCYEVPQAYRAILPVMESVLSEPIDMRDHKPTAAEIDIAYFQETVPPRQSQYESMRKKLAQHNLRLVVSIAKNYRDRGLPFTDLVGLGNVGLMKAVDRFDHEVSRFSTYATWWIRQSIRRGITDNKRIIRVPSYLHPKIGKLQQEAIERSTEEGRTISPLEVAVERVREDDFEIIMAALTILGNGQFISIDGDGRLAPDSDGRGTHIQDTKVHEGIVEDASESESLRKHLDRLNKRDRDVLIMRYYNGFTLQEVGNKINLSRERVRQIEGEALRKLNELMSRADAA